MNQEDYDFSNTTIDKKTALSSYGTEAQINFFNKHNKLNSANERGLIYTLDQHYQSVEKVKVGRSYHYSLGEKRAVIAVRQDARMFNGSRQANSIDYTKSLDIIVAKYIDFREPKDENKAKTYKSWLVEIGLISQKVALLMNSRYSKKSKKSAFFPLIEEGIIRGESEYYIIDEYLSKVDELSIQLQRSLKRLERARVISLNKVYRKKVEKYRIKDGQDKLEEDDDLLSKKGKMDSVDWLNVSEESFFQAKQVDKNLLSKHGITLWQSQNLTNLDAVKEYLNEKEEIRGVEVNEEGYIVVDQFYYTAYEIVKITDESALKGYLEVYYPDEASFVMDDYIPLVSYHYQKFYISREKRVSDSLGEIIQQKFDNNVKGMDRLGAKKSKLYNPNRFNTVIKKIQSKNNEWITKERKMKNNDERQDDSDE